MILPRRLPLLFCLLVCHLPLHAANEGMATFFLGVGFPYGACGVSEDVALAEGAIDTLTGQGNPFDYVALNVFNTPGIYNMPAARPLKGLDTLLAGVYDNGRNCGRWLKLSLGDTCDGTNDGAENQPFCRGGTGWHPNEYTGASIYAVVFDQCSDGNGWCRDSKYHVDLHGTILSRLRKNGVLLPPMGSRFLNPKISWDFVPAPAYQGEPRFYFSMDSKDWYMRLIVTHLPEGLHGVEQLVNCVWQKATMDGDAGQMYLLPSPTGTHFTLRLTDANNLPVLGGRTWNLDFPKACGTSCTKPATLADNLVGMGGNTSILDHSAPQMAPHLGQHGVLQFPSSDQGTLELFSLSGNILTSLPISQGRAVLPKLSRGLWIGRWSLSRSHGAIPILIP